MRTLAAPPGTRSKKIGSEWSLLGRFEDGCEEQRAKHCGFLCPFFLISISSGFRSCQPSSWHSTETPLEDRSVCECLLTGGPGFASWGPASMEVDTEEHLL